jgi:hypothetical protein
MHKYEVRDPAHTKKARPVLSCSSSCSERPGLSRGSDTSTARHGPMWLRMSLSMHTEIGSFLVSHPKPSHMERGRLSSSHRPTRRTGVNDAVAFARDTSPHKIRTRQKRNPEKGPPPRTIYHIVVVLLLPNFVRILIDELIEHDEPKTRRRWHSDSGPEQQNPSNHQ